MISVFIVEDTLDMQTLLQHVILTANDFLLLGLAKNGEEALSKIPECQPDIVIMDLGLPDMSGVQCITALKPQCPETEFVVFTVSLHDEDVFESIKAGATSYLVKTIDPDDLLISLREVYDGGSPIDSHIARKLLAAFTKTKRKDEAKKAAYGLSKREHEMLENLSKGLSYQEAAEAMYITVGALKSYVYNTYEKLNVKNKTEAINKYFG